MCRPVPVPGSYLVPPTLGFYPLREKIESRPRRARILQPRFEQKLESYGLNQLGLAFEEPDYDSPEIPDDRFRLIFTCCHPALALEAQVALTLRTLCGIETDEIARAFLVPATTMAQRLVRAKRGISGPKFAKRYASLYAARADLLRRLGFSEDAAKSYQRALSLVTNHSEHRFLERRLREVQPPPGRENRIKGRCGSQFCQPGCRHTVPGRSVSPVDAAW